MPIMIQCSGCQRWYNAPDKLVGKAVQCKHCGVHIPVPAAATGTAPATATMPLPVPAPAQPAAPAPFVGVNLPDLNALSAAPVGPAWPGAAPAGGSPFPLGGPAPAQAPGTSWTPQPLAPAAQPLSKRRSDFPLGMWVGIVGGALGVAIVLAVIILMAGRKSDTQSTQATPPITTPPSTTPPGYTPPNYTPNYTPPTYTPPSYTPPTIPPPPSIPTPDLTPPNMFPPGMTPNSPPNRMPGMPPSTRPRSSRIKSRPMPGMPSPNSMMPSGTPSTIPPPADVPAGMSSAPNPPAAGEPPASGLPITLWDARSSGAGMLEFSVRYRVEQRQYVETLRMRTYWVVQDGSGRVEFHLFPHDWEPRGELQGTAAAARQGKSETWLETGSMSRFAKDRKRISNVVELK